MADPTIDATAKGASANSYVTRSAAQAYYDARLNVSEWTAAEDGDKDRSLIQATNRLEMEDYVEWPTTLTQRLQWPRNAVLKPSGDTFDNDAVPRPVKEATYELALAYLKGEAGLADIGLEAFKNVKVGPLDVTPRATRKGDALPAVVRHLLRGLRVQVGEINAPAVKS